MIAAILLILITIILPPVGVFCVAGCGMDLLINILLTILGVVPGHIHAFYVEYVYYARLEQAKAGRLDQTPPQGVYSDNIIRGGQAQQQGYGTV